MLQAVSATPELPETTLHMDGESLTFWVDSGETHSVIQDKHSQNPKMGGRFVYSKSACGMVVREKFTMPILCSNTIDGDTESVKHGFLLSPVCPVNLLEGDRMLQLYISLIFTPDGLKVISTFGPRAIVWTSTDYGSLEMCDPGTAFEIDSTHNILNVDFHCWTMTIILWVGLLQLEYFERYAITTKKSAINDSHILYVIQTPLHYRN